MTFPAQSPDLRRFPLVAGASRSVVRSPRSAAPRIRFLFVDSRVRFTLRSAYASRRTPCASLRSLRPGSGRTFTSKSSPMPGPPPRKGPGLSAGPSPQLPLESEDSTIALTSWQIPCHPSRNQRHTRVVHADGVEHVVTCCPRTHKGVDVICTSIHLIGPYTLGTGLKNTVDTTHRFDQPEFGAVSASPSRLRRRC